MLLFILKNAIISIILIILLHYIYDYFKTNLTTPKVKDLVNKPQIQYDEIIKTIKESKDINHNELIEKEEKEVMSTLTVTVGLSSVLILLGIPKL